MIESTCFVCEICRVRYEHKRQAMLCEKNHANLDKLYITRLKFNWNDYKRPIDSAFYFPTSVNLNRFSIKESKRADFVDSVKYDIKQIFSSGQYIGDINAKP